MTVTESETPQIIPIQISLSDVWLGADVYCAVSGTAQNGVAYNAPWSGSSFYVPFNEYDGGTYGYDFSITSGVNISFAANAHCDFDQ